MQTFSSLAQSSLGKQFERRTWNRWSGCMHCLDFSSINPPQDYRASTTIGMSHTVISTTSLLKLIDIWLNSSARSRASANWWTGCCSWEWRGAASSSSCCSAAKFGTGMKRSINLRTKWCAMMLWIKNSNDVEHLMHWKLSASIDATGATLDRYFDRPVLVT